jgi:hypothetical protein
VQRERAKMKISELMKWMDGVQEENGDLDVVVDCGFQYRDYHYIGPGEDIEFDENAKPRSVIIYPERKKLDIVL